MTRRFPTFGDVVAVYVLQRMPAGYNDYVRYVGRVTSHPKVREVDGLTGARLLTIDNRHIVLRDRCKLVRRRITPKLVKPRRLPVMA